LLQQLSDAEKVVVVDYGDPDGVFEYCMSLANPHIVGARILENTDIFNLSHARNCGANVLNSDVLLFFDADSVLRPGFISHAVGLIRIGRAVLTRRDLRDGRADTCGLCCVRTDIFHEAHGYDEQFQGWGPEDSDFYSRVRRLGIVHTFPGRLYPATLKHSDADRTRFYHCKDRSESARRSGALMGNPLRVVNPAGYGRAKARICSVLNEPACSASVI
jgi:predicted glycosyltransferase involved in capsule biosynthesis